ncbi:MAG: glycosyltransferase [Chloroflexota bacterium]|nr:glycosyltransferase [Chloroflexota bacterium]
MGAYQTKLEQIAAHEDIDLTVVVPPRWREGDHTLHLERAHTAGYRLVVTPMMFNGFFHMHFYPQLHAILRESRPHICHIDEEPYNLATYLALRTARRQGAKTLFFTWQNLLRRYPFPFRAMECFVHRHADAAIAGSEGAASVLREKGYQGPLRVIPQFGVDPDLFSPALADEPTRPFTIGYAGRLVEEKGLYTLADALADLQGTWRLILVGRGPLRHALKGRFSELGLKQRVTFHNQVPSEQMPHHFRAMDTLVLPSLTKPNWKEQFGRVVIEAMACGVPVIGSDSGEIPHVVGDGGLIFPEGNTEALRESLSSLRDNVARRRALGQKGRARVLSLYTQSRIAAETVALYRDLHAGRL